MSSALSGRQRWAPEQATNCLYKLMILSWEEAIPNSSGFGGRVDDIEIRCDGISTFLRQCDDKRHQKNGGLKRRTITRFSTHHQGRKIFSACMVLHSLKGGSVTSRTSSTKCVRNSSLDDTMKIRIDREKLDKVELQVRTKLQLSYRTP